jgi:argininosuccinate lyase
MHNKTWGGRFKKPLDPRVIKFNASLPFDHVLYEYDILGSKAHVRMLAKQKLITLEEANIICSSLEEIRLELKQGLHSFDVVYEDIHMFIEQLLIKKIGNTGKKLHTGRSRNDQVALDLRLYTRHEGTQIENLLHSLTLTLQALAEKHVSDKMPGYTHLQQAQAISLGQYFQAYLDMFNRDIHRIQDWHKRMNFSPLGAGALAGSILPLDRHHVAEELAFDAVINNTIDAVSDRDYLIEFGSIASIIMMHLSRLSEDLILWASQEFNFVILSDAFSTGSSLMPNKKNPDVLELIRGKSGRVFGHLMGILTVMKGLPLAYNKDMQEDKEALFDTANTLTTCLEIITPFLNSLQFNIDVMAEKAANGYLHATKIVESLVLKGVPFRDAHHQVGQWIAEAVEENSSLEDIINREQAAITANDTRIINTFHICEQDGSKNIVQLCHKRKLDAMLPAFHKEIRPSEKTRHLLTGMELTPTDIQTILYTATHIKKDPKKFSKELTGKSLVMIFDKPSFRTRLSFALAIQGLGGYFVESVKNTCKAEEPGDVIKVLNGYCDFVMVRTHDDEVLAKMAKYADKPIINGLSALYHPCQILADLLTLYEHFGYLEGLTVTYVGDGNNILHSLVLLLPLLGVHVKYCCPIQNQPRAEVMQYCKNELVTKYSVLEEAVCGAQAIYTDVWTSMGFEGQTQEVNFSNFQVNETLMMQAQPGAVFMHCMPMQRGKEVSASLPDSNASVVFRQSANRTHVQKAVLLFLRGTTS